MVGQRASRRCCANAAWIVVQGASGTWNWNKQSKRNPRAKQSQLHGNACLHNLGGQVGQHRVLGAPQDEGHDLQVGG